MNIKFIAVPAIALAAGLSLASCSSTRYAAPPAAPAQGGTAPGDPAPAATPTTSITPGSATVAQICQDAIGATSTDGATVTASQTISAYDPSSVPPPRGGGNGGFQNTVCYLTLSDGRQGNAGVQLNANGSLNFSG